MNIAYNVMTILSFAILLGLIIFAIISFIRKLRKPKIKSTPLQKVFRIATAICIILVALSWILNMGWFRFILTWTAFPVIHAILFWIVCSKAISNIYICGTLKLNITTLFITYVGAYLLFPDFGDHGPQYMFFGLIRNDTIIGISGNLSIALFIINVIFMIYTAFKIKKELKKPKRNA